MSSKEKQTKLFQHLGGLLLQQLGADFQDSYTKALWLLCKTQQLQMHLASLQRCSAL